MKEILYNYAYNLVKSNFMRLPILLCGCLIFWLSGCAERSAPNMVLSDEWQAIDWLQGQAVEGNWASTQEFGDFALRGEFFLDEGQSNFIRLRQSGKSFSEGGYPISLSYETDQQNTLGTIMGYARASSIDSISSKAWNRFEIHAQSSEIKVFINDQLLTQCQDQAFAEGKIVFQATHKLVGLEEQFRNLELKALPALPTGADLDSLRKDGKAKAKPALQSSLQGWHQSGSASWELVDGVLTGQSGTEGGYLISDSLYKNLYFRAQFRIAKEDNSGIFIRLHPDSNNISVQAGIECNIYDHNGFEHAFSTGSIVAHARAFGQLIDYEDWNEFEILAYEDQIVLYINGEESADHRFAERFEQKGHIALQAGIRIFAGQGPSTIQFKEMKLAVFD